MMKLRFVYKHLSLAVVCAFTLSACSSPKSDDMFRKTVKEKAPIAYAKRSPSQQDPAKQNSAKEGVAPLVNKRLLSAKAFGLDENSKPEKLIGFVASDLRQALGKPDFIRKDIGVEIWQYHVENCVLDLFLYQNEAGLRVNHSELRSDTPNRPLKSNCFETILNGQSS